MSIRIDRLKRPHHRREVGDERRIGFVVHDLQSGRLGVGAGAVATGQPEFGIGGGNRHSLRLRVLLHRDLEPAPGKRKRALRAARDHGKVPRVVEVLVDVHAEHADRQLVVLHDDRHRRRDHVGGIGADQQIDLVDADELCVDAGHVRRSALVVVIDELYRPAQQPAFGIDIIAPDLERQQKLLAVGRNSTGQGDAEADLYRIGGVRRSGQPRQRQRGDQQQRSECAQCCPQTRNEKHSAFLPCL